MTLSVEMIAALSAHYLREFTNALVYRHLASWAEFEGFFGCASWLRAQAAGELEHAERVVAYIEARNESVIPGGILPDFASPYNIQALFERVQELERETSAKLAEIKALAERDGDVMTCQWLLDHDGLIREQVEEENVAQSILDRIARRIEVNGLDGDALMDIDRMVGAL